MVEPTARLKSTNQHDRTNVGAIFTCSIDDGHPSDMRVAELLDRHALNGTFYVPIRNCEGPPVISSAGIREIGKRFEVGSHTLDHRFLNGVALADARTQIEEGKKILEQQLGAPTYGFCYPGGKYRDKHVGLVKSSGFRYARTTMNLCFDAGAARFEMPTTCQFYPHKRSVYVRNFARSGRWSRRMAGLGIALEQENWIDRIYGLFEYAHYHDGIFHLWAHSRDIDALGAWHEFDDFLAHVAFNVPKNNRLSNYQLATRYFRS